MSEDCIRKAEDALNEYLSNHTPDLQSQLTTALARAESAEKRIADVEAEIGKETGGIISPSCADLLAYLNYQFPATVGNIPLKEFCENLKLVVGFAKFYNKQGQENRNLRMDIYTLETRNRQLVQAMGEAVKALETCEDFKDLADDYDCGQSTRHTTTRQRFDKRKVASALALLKEMGKESAPPPSPPLPHPQS